MTTWQIDRLTYEGHVPHHGGEGSTTWEFTAVVEGRSYPIYLIIQNRLLVRHAGLPPQQPPPAELVPKLITYLRRRLEHPVTRDRYPRSLRGAEIHMQMKAEWQELTATDPCSAHPPNHSRFC